LYKRALCDPDKTRNEALLRISFRGFLLADLLLLDLLHDKLLNLAGDGGGEALDKLHVAGDLEVRQLKMKNIILLLQITYITTFSNAVILINC
jgi:hypothetical protein